MFVLKHANMINSSWIACP